MENYPWKMMICIETWPFICNSRYRCILDVCPPVVWIHAAILLRGTGCLRHGYYPLPQMADSVWPLIRQSQRAVLRMPATGFATTIDLGTTGGNVHRPRKQEVGRRLSLQLLANQNDTGAVAAPEALVAGPVSVDAHILGTTNNSLRARVRLRSASGLHYAPTANCSSRGSGLCCDESPFDASFAGGGRYSFQLALFPAPSTITTNTDGTATLDLSFPCPPGMLLSAVSAGDIRYAWRGFPQCVLYNGHGGFASRTSVAAAPFRFALGSDSGEGVCPPNVPACADTVYDGTTQCCGRVPVYVERQARGGEEKSVAWDFRRDEACVEDVGCFNALPLA